VTLQPVRRHGVDAAVMFADIMLPVLGMGVEVELVENVGPVVAAPIRSLADVERLVVPEPEESVPWTLESVRLVREALLPDQAVIGFAGGPFTVAGYRSRASRRASSNRRRRACTGARVRALMKLADAFTATWPAAFGPGRMCSAVRLVGRRARLRLPRVRRATQPACWTLSRCRRFTSPRATPICWRSGGGRRGRNRVDSGPLDVAWERVGYDRGIRERTALPCSGRGAGERETGTSCAAR
jgi:uroporphyrinogen decarboxylase